MKKINRKSKIITVPETQIVVASPRRRHMKQIVPKSQITSDPKLTLIKAFRVLNKHVGELKHEESEDDSSASQAKIDIQKMNALTKKALAEYDFHIWVNEDGQTGHTYEKDYKITPESCNDWDAYQAELAQRNAAVVQLIDSIQVDNDDDGNDDTLN